MIYIFFAEAPDGVRRVLCLSTCVLAILTLLGPFFLNLSYAQAPKASRMGDTKAEAARLVDDGWAMFVGTNGVVDEFEALRMTAEGVQLARAAEAPLALSIGMNNLGVIHMCAADARVRDYEFGRKVMQREVGNNDVSSDNFIWDVFLRKKEVDSSKFVELVKSNFSDHPVSQYIRKNNGRLPRTGTDALKILEREAIDGDPYAAKRIAFQYECRKEEIDIKRALFWFSLSSENAKKKNLPERLSQSIDERKNRLTILEAGNR